MEWDSWDQAAFADRIARSLAAFIDERDAALADLGADAERLVAAARHAVGGGKRLRASFCWWGFAAIIEPSDPDALVRAAASLELLHASALVHDDLMDASDTRRGAPSIHRAFEAAHRQASLPGRAEPYGAAAAILLGDLLLSWSDQLLRHTGFDLSATARAMEVLDVCRNEVIAGQFLDVSVQARGRADVETAMTVLRYKSAKYSIERPLHLGAALAGGSTSAREALTGFGLPLGEAFQLRDDLLGVFGDPEVTGKPAGDDLVEGKRTVLVALALDGAPSGDARMLDEALGRDLSDAEVARMRRIITDSGAAGQVEEAIEALTATALESLESSVASGVVRADAAGVLAGLASAATKRSL
ncbi:polyprenyl synthetase family protein [soil metagenome]